MSESYFTKLASVDVSKHVEKKQGLSYLSWSWAVDQLMRHDHLANWVFHDPIMFGETMMVSCTVTAFGKPMTMHLPVMDHRNQAIKNPDAFQVNKNMMRCLVKAIACHGLGLYIYSGEDLPNEDDVKPKSAPKSEPKVEAKSEAKVPGKIEGQEGGWQLKITTEPGSDPVEWASLVIEMTKLALEQCIYADDPMKVFKVNRNIYDLTKQVAPSAYDVLMEEFKTAKAKFKDSK